MSLLNLTMFLFFFSSLCYGANSYGWSIYRSTLYSGLVKCDHRKDQNLDVSDVKLYFYDFQNNVNLSFPINSAVKGLTGYKLDESKRLIFFVPGYKSHINKASVDLIRQAFKNVPDVYLIVVDHSPYTSAKDGMMKGYGKSVSYTYYLGKALGEFLAGLRKYGFPSKNIHCVGHSLGSQMLGYAGVTYFNKTSEKVARISGIDPAGPCFSNALIDEQIRAGVADYVDVYHCNAGGLGTTAVLADADFFFNRKGKTQPGCGGGFASIVPGYGDYTTSKCSHRACLRYWALSVQNSDWFLATSCDSYEEYKAGACAQNEKTIAGYYSPGNATGVFYVSTQFHGIS